MKIECLIKRPGGTKYQDFLKSGIDYHFKPEKGNGPHVCEVKERAHIKRFLSITEGFEFVGEETGEVGAIKFEISEETPDEAKVVASRWPDIMDINVDDREAWPNKRLNQYAMDSMQINPGSKTDIHNYAAEMYSIELPQKSINQPAPLLRELIRRIQQQRRESAAASHIGP